jgi:hypothetical protein
MGQSAAGEGATVNMAKSGPAVMAAAGRRKQRSSRLQAHVLLETCSQILRVKNKAT